MTGEILNYVLACGLFFVILAVVVHFVRMRVNPEYRKNMSTGREKPGDEEQKDPRGGWRSDRN